MSVFVSYASKDREWAQKLITQLTDRGVGVWDPASELLPGDNWPLETGKALQRARAIIVLVSPAASRSSNVQREVEYAIASKKFRDRLIPVVVKPTTKLPWILRHLDPIKSQDLAKVSERIVERLRQSEALN